MEELTFGEIMAFSHELIAILDFDGKFKRLSPSCPALTGYDIGELIGADPLEHIHPEDMASLQFRLASVRGSGGVESLRHRFRLKNGTYRWFDTIIQIHRENGKFKHLVTSSRDVTTQVEAQQKLSDSRTRYELLAKNIPGVLYLCNNDETFSMIYLNDKVLEVTGYPSSEFFDESIDFVKLYHPEDADRIFGTVEEALEKKIPYNLVYRIKHRNGQWRWIEEHGQGIYDGDELRFLEGVLLDITELRTTQQELKKLVTNLEGVIKERTIELQEKNDELIANNQTLSETISKLEETQHHLIQSEKLASLGTLLAGVGHELNNPLNFIQNGASVLKRRLKEDGLLNGEIEMLLEGVVEGASRTTQIVKSLGQFSRQIDNREEKCPIHDILDNCLKILENKLKHRITVNKTYTEKECVIVGNGGRLHQAFLNILVNAEQAIQDEGFINLDTELSEEGLVVRIKDSGQGIAPENMSKITDPFFTTKDPGKGTGLGLSITHQIIEEHNGTIQVMSEPEKGTEFIVSLSLN